jgi:hypothetical protein
MFGALGPAAAAHCMGHAAAPPLIFFNQRRQ